LKTGSEGAVSAFLPRPFPPTGDSASPLDFWCFLFSVPLHPPQSLWHRQTFDLPVTWVSFVFACHARGSDSSSSSHWDGPLTCIFGFHVSCSLFPPLCPPLDPFFSVLYFSLICCHISVSQFRHPYSLLTLQCSAPRDWTLPNAGLCTDPLCRTAQVLH